jgi:hypothetical protein
LRQSETIGAIRNLWGNQKPLGKSETIGEIRNHWGNQKQLGKSETIGAIRNHWGNQKPVTLNLLLKLKYNVIHIIYIVGNVGVSI